ncbi:hypothetical protein HU200_036613 [Digitaria exilis]|uniref:Cytochrome P450 n=1 Tax=Digitaria exilis TaxID=1010633 RepID=A0A835BGA1_9POAL|nr:hypothetical protein HU200_036613 [Digitaria exilis]
MLEWAWLAPRRMERALRAQGLKGTRYRFLWGDLKEERRQAVEALSRPVSMDRPHDVLPRVSPLLHRAVEEHGKLSFTWFGTTPRVTIIDPELVREVTSNKDGYFVKTKLATRIVKLLIGGVAILDGEKWAKHRRIMNPAFHAEKLKGMLPAFFSACSDLICRWDNLIANSTETIELDIWSEFQNLSGDVLSRAVFGVSYQEGRKIFVLQAEQLVRVIQSFGTNHIPGFSLLPTKNNRRMKAINRETKKILRGIIEKRYEAMENGERTETTAVLLTWTMVALSMHPEWLDRARDEVLQVFGQNKPDLSGINRLKVVTMVLYEVLRLYPPALFLNRRTHKQTELAGVMYPPDVMFVIPIMFIHRDPVFWGPDAGEFNPGRFAEGVSKACSDPGAFIPFSWGPRVCIGQNFALLEAKLGISMILQRFAFELSPAYVHAPYSILTLHPQHSVLVRVRRL